MLYPSAEVPLNREPVSDSSLHTNDSHGAMNFGARARKTAQNYENYRHWDGGGLQFGGETKPEDDSGVCSPPLWKTSPGTSPQHHQNNYRYLSPASKTQAIVRGQRELMEMIRNMPESSYELSLKDLVEHQRTDVRRETVIEEKDRSNEVVAYRNGKEKRKGEKKGRMMRSESLDNNGGLFLKMVFPFSFGTKSKIKKTNLAMNPCSKVSPKPLPPAGAEGSGKGVDKEWWKRRFSVSGESESGGISSNSGSRRSSGSSRSSSSGSSSNRNRYVL